MVTIKNPKVEALVRQLAAGAGVSLTKAVERAVIHELERCSEARERKLALMRSIADRVAALPILDSRTDEQILDYDRRGLLGCDFAKTDAKKLGAKRT